MDRLTAMIPLMAQERPIERTALNRLLYFADLTHLLEHGGTISGAPQLKCCQGPKPRGSFEARCRAIGAGLLDESVTEARPACHYSPLCCIGRQARYSDSRSR